METSQSERAAVAAVQSPTVPLAVLVQALNALNRSLSQRHSETTSFDTYEVLARASGSLGYYVDRMLAAQAVGVMS